MKRLFDKALCAEPLTRDEIFQLINGVTSDDELHELAHEITRKYLGNRFDTCSIINAKSGNCSEDCKWCAQSAHHNTTVEIYPLIDKSQAITEATHNAECGIKRFSLVTSGKRSSSRDIDALCSITAALPKSVIPCASLGLVDRDSLEKLFAAGITRYHCNLESSPRYFKKLCTTHTTEDKLETLRSARKVGMTLCSGGIIGMGESLEDRVDMALLLRDEQVMSIPINLLQPIPGTPLQGVAPISEEEYLLTVALFRIINPKAFLRFSGGRAQLSKQSQLRALYIGINAAIMGDMLTTLGSGAKEDMEMFKTAGYNMEWSGENPYDKYAYRDEK
ncbi:MAG: biotin synthase BioB [Rikenellaceae bacterium]